MWLMGSRAPFMTLAWLLLYSTGYVKTKVPDAGEIREVDLDQIACELGDIGVWATVSTRTTPEPFSG